MTKTIHTSFTPNNSRCLENWVNTEHKLLGLSLRPYCILHLQWLEYLESPLFFTSEVITLADVELAALVCSSSSSGEILGKIGGNSLSRRFWRLRNRRKDLRAEVGKFIAYQDDYCSLPEFAVAEGKSAGLENIPWLLLQAATVVRETGWSMDTALTTPVGQVIWLNSAFAYLTTGETAVVSDKERAAYAAIAQLTQGGV